MMVVTVSPHGRALFTNHIARSAPGDITDLAAVTRFASSTIVLVIPAVLFVALPMAVATAIAGLGAEGEEGQGEYGCQYFLFHSASSDEPIPTLFNRIRD